MKQKLKRVLGLLLAIALVVGMVPSFVMGKDVIEGSASTILTIKDLNKTNVEGSHVGDNYRGSYMEVNFRETEELDASKTTSASTTVKNRYNHAFYPRIKKVKDDLYVMFWHYGSLGQHIYWSSSTDCKKWSDPKVLWNSANHKFTYEDGYGSLAGTADRLYAVNADACVLNNGEILCVFAVRPNEGYKKAEYTDLNGIYMMRGTVSGSTITWTKETEAKKIYTGHVWEPFIRQRDDGKVEVYWSSITEHIQEYGFDNEKRCTYVAMISSDDNGKTWTPNVQDGNTNNYVANRIFKQYIGNKIPEGGTTAVPYYGGQMPSAVTLYNGKTLLAAEVQALPVAGETTGAFTISLTQSQADGVWNLLGQTEATPDGDIVKEVTGEKGEGPYLARFPSGEVLLTYTSSKTLLGRIVSPDGKSVSSTTVKLAGDAIGVWGSTELVGSHEILTAAQRRVSSTTNSQGDTVYTYGIRLTHSYLNHRINAGTHAVTVGGDTKEWANNTDAFFVGSGSQAQSTIQVAQDDDNVYFLINRLDNDLRLGDTTATKDFTKICIATGAQSAYELLVLADGTVSLLNANYAANTSQATGTSKYISVAVTTKGTLDDDQADEGAVYELAVPKSLIGLTGKDSFQMRFAIHNADASSTNDDNMDGISLKNTTDWPEVVLECDHNFVNGICALCGADISNHSEKESLYTNKYVSVDASGNYILNLEAYGKGNTTALTYVKPADIVLVLDSSASMYTPAGASGTVATYKKDSETVKVDYTGRVTPSSTVVYDDDIAKYAIPQVSNQNRNIDKQKAKHLGYYIAQSTETQTWWLIKYFENETFSPNYKNYTGWGCYELDDFKGTNATVALDTLDPTKSTGKYAVVNNTTDKVPYDYLPARFTVWKTQYGALYDAVESFLVDLKESNVDHRVSITTFCGAANQVPVCIMAPKRSCSGLCMAAPAMKAALPMRIMQSKWPIIISTFWRAR